MSMSARLAAAALASIGAAIGALALVGNSAPELPPDLSWSPGRYAEDWPLPPRPEPPGGAPDVLLVRGDNTHWDAAEQAWEGLEHVDPIGDVGPGAIPAVDIREVGGPGAGLASYSIRLAAAVPFSATDPRSRWIAYGIVIDTNGDGRADERVGIDNTPDGTHRAWVTDLASGGTKWKVGPPYGDVGDDGGATGRVGLDTYHPGEAFADPDSAILRYSGGSGRFYAWASMIEDGRVVATDYAPDVGWLVNPEDPGLPLEGTTWSIWREFPSRSLSVQMWLIFLPEGRVSLELCQRGDATVQVTPDTMRFTDIALAGDSCSPEVTEMAAEILEVLAADELSYTLDAGTLELSDGANVLRLEGTTDPPPGY